MSIIAKYKFDKSIYENLIPEFNEGYTGYTISDEIDSENSNHVIRTIEASILPTYMRFGKTWINDEQDVIQAPRASSLLEVINLDTSALTDMNEMFRGCYNVTNISCSWNTSNVYSMVNTFEGCNKLTSLDVSNWNTSKVTSMFGTFKDCFLLTTIDVSNWNTENVLDMHKMFYGCQSLTSLDVSNWDTSKVTNMYAMFCNCRELTSLDVNNWDTSNVTNMSYMFSGCNNLTSLDVSRWNVENSGTLHNMFRDCINLNSIDISNWNLKNDAHLYSMFSGCENIEKISLCSLPEQIMHIHHIFSGCNNLIEVDLKNLNLYNITNSDQADIVEDKIKYDLFGVNIISYIIPANIKKITIQHTSVVKELTRLNLLIDRTGKEAGQIVTVIRDQIDEETLAALTAKNWVVKDLVAQYVFDANTYENLLPEFNAEFTEDMYEVHDSISEIVIDGFKWKNGSIHNATGSDVKESEENENRFFINYRKSDFVPVIGNVELISNYKINSIVYYDESKKCIGYNSNTATTDIILPNNTKYIRLTVHKDNTPDYDNLTLTAKLVTRSIESKNGDLPTLMRFGDIQAEDVVVNSSRALLSVFDMNTTNLESMYGMFNKCRRVTKISCNWDTSNVTNMQGAFAYCYSLSELDVSNFNTSNVTNMYGMFLCGNVIEINDNKIEIIDATNWDTSKVTNMGFMFYCCRNTKQIKFGEKFVTNNVTYMERMFCGCLNLTSLDVSNFDTSKVTNMSNMFYNCNKITSLDVSGFDTSNVIDMGGMFSNCNNLTSLDVSGFDTSKVTNMRYMFCDCNTLTSLDLSNFDTSKVTNMLGMFQNCYNLTELDVSNFNTSKVTNMDNIFHKCTRISTFDVSNWDVSKVTNMNNMFNTCTSLTKLDVSKWNTESLTDIDCVVYGCYQLTELDVSNWKTGKITEMHNAFAGCSGLTTLDVSKWDTSNMRLMGSAFERCTKLSTLDISNWNTSNVTNMNSMFNSCKSLATIDVSKWDVSKVTDMNNMFYDCQALTSLDVTNWNTSSLRDITSLFYACVNLKTLDVSQWDVSKCGYITGQESYSMRNVFNDTGLRVLNLSKWSKIEWLYDTLEDGRICNNFINSTVLKTIDFGNCSIPYYPVNWLKAPNLRYIKCDNGTSVSNLIEQVPTRTEAEPGYIITTAEISDDHKGLFNAKYWNVVNIEEAGTEIAVYKFDKNVYKSLVPAFDTNFSDWFIDDVVEDEVNAPNIVTRTIRSMGGLPTLMKFGVTSSLGSYKDRSLSLLEVYKLNTSNITNMGQMFKRCTGVTMINTADWDVSNVTTMHEMFFECAKITSLDVSNWDTRKVNNMSSIFIHCFRLQNIIGLNNWDTRNAQTMQWMFQDCQSLKSVDLSNWNTSKVNNMGSMFRYAISLESLDLSSFDTRAVTNMSYMFAGIDYGNYNPMSLTSITFGENFNTSNVTNMSSMFRNCQALTSLDVSNFNTSNVTNMKYMFGNCKLLTSLDVSNFDTSKVTDMGAMFNNCYNLTSLDVSNFNTSNVTTMSQMFYYCNSLTSLDVSKWNTSKVTDMSYMFWDCFNLSTLDVSNWDISKVNSTNHMFVRCKSLTSLDVSNWDTSNVTDMDSMFWECSSLTSLDLSNFNTSNVTNMSWMIYKCYALTSLDVSNFDTSNVTDMDGMFRDSGLVADIGMIYCDFNTVEKVASLITNPTTIWVGSYIDINGLPQYEHITYKVYEVEDKLEVELSSPLLEGDRLEIIDGDLYHYHKMGIITYDGSNDESHWAYGLSENGWVQDENYHAFHNYYTYNTYSLWEKLITKESNLSCDRLPSYRYNYLNNTQVSVEAIRTEGICIGWHNVNGYDFHYITIRIHKDKLPTIDSDGFKAWLVANPITITYERANPYYELVKPNVGLLNAEQGLYLNISDSVVPVVNHQDLCTLKLNYLLPNVEYKVKFKANNAGSIAINLGGTLVPLDVVEGWNEVMVTTPGTLVDEYLKVNGSEGIKIQNVMVIDSNKDFDYFKGMNNTFDEIPVKNICKNRTLTYTHGVDEEGVSPQGEMNVNVNKGKVVTVVGRVTNNPNNLPISINLYNDTGRATGKNLMPVMDIANPDEHWEYSGNGSTPIQYDSEAQGFYCNTNRQHTIKDIKNETVYTISLDGKINLNKDPDSYWGCLIENGGGDMHREHLRTTSNEWKRLSVSTTTRNQLTLFMYSAICFKNIQVEEGGIATEYEPFRNYVNDNPKFIVSSASSVALVDVALTDVATVDENGYFAITIRADRDYANRIGFNVEDVSSCEANDQVTITDLMVFEGDILDCHPTTYVDPADTRYLVEYKSIGNPFGFGKNKLI